MIFNAYNNESFPSAPLSFYQKFRKTNLKYIVIVISVGESHAPPWRALSSSTSEALWFVLFVKVL